MTEKSNNSDPFEDFFKRKEEEIDIPFREDDWDKLEAKLDLVDAKLAYRRKTRFIAAAVLLIVSLLGYFTYENYVKIGELNRLLEQEMTINTPSSELKDEQDFLVEGDGNATTEEQGENNRSASDPLLNKNDSQPEEDSDHKVIVSSDSLDVTSNLMNDFNEYQPVMDGIAQADLPGSWDCTSCRNGDYYAQIVSGEIATPKIENYRKNPATRSQVNTGYRSGQYFFHENSAESSIRSKVTIGLKASPDLSTVGGLSNFQSPGYSLGLEIGYNVTENITLSTGIMRNTVRYSASGSGYDPPNYLTGGELPDQIEGVCTLLDIPLSAKYNVINFSQSRIFAKASLSSYIMLNEAYDFRFEQSYSERASYSYSGHTGTSHWMSNAGISVGFEMDLNARWSVRAEPQIKIPIRQVGLSNVRLYSLGSFISLNFKL